MSTSALAVSIPQRLLSSLPSSAEEFRELFLRSAREAVQRLASSLMEMEARSLAGRRYGRDGKSGEFFRAGSDPGSIRVGGQRVRVRKQRLKDGVGKEVPLMSYLSLRRGDLLTERVMAMMIRGISTRKYDDLVEEVAGGLGLSKSSVSRAFADGSRQALDNLENRKLGGKLFCAVMVDGIVFARRAEAVASLDEGGEDLLTLHRIGAGRILRTTLQYLLGHEPHREHVRRRATGDPAGG